MTAIAATIVGPHVDRPSPLQNTGLLWVDSDTSLRYLSDGTKWTDYSFNPGGDVNVGGKVVAVGTGAFSDVSVAEGSLTHVKSGTVARTDTAAKDLFTLPANAVIRNIRIYGTVGSDAATTATLVLGKKTGNGHEYMTAHSVKDAAGVGFASAAETQLGTIGTSAVTVTGTYAETGDAASTGGPWTCQVEYTTS